MLLVIFSFTVCHQLKHGLLFDDNIRGGGVLMSCMVVVVQSMAVDPRILTMPGRSTSGFHLPERGIAFIKREAQ